MVPAVGPTDAATVARARDGDVDAFEALVLDNHATLYRLAARMTGNAADAEEIVQDAFMQAFQSLDAFRGEARFSTWLHRIAVNVALMKLRRDRRRPVESLEEYLPRFGDTGLHEQLDCDASLPSPEEIVDSEDLQRDVLLALERMPERYRVPFVLRDLEGLDATDVAATLGIEPATLRQRIHRARLMLRGFLWKRLRGEP